MKLQKRHIQRNDPCPCGSGKKVKKCCLHLINEMKQNLETAERVLTPMQRLRLLTGKPSEPDKQPDP